MVYLDNAATTRALPEVAEAMADALLRDFGNPSSLHRLGVQAERVLSRARRQVAAALAVTEEEIIFTSGGTEGNNLGIKGAARARAREGRHVITTAIEHQSVLRACQELSAEGFRVTVLPVDPAGYLQPETLRQALQPDTILVAFAQVNNEIGVIQPVAQLAAVVHKQHGARGPAAIHVDAVQALGKLPVTPALWQVDLCAVSAHKIHGPKGSGALYVRKGTRLAPLASGGEQEQQLRPGTENLPGVAGFAVALQAALEAQAQAVTDMYAHKARLLERLTHLLGEAPQVNGPPLAEAAPHILNLSFPGLRGEVLIHACEEQEVYLSTGSACTSANPEPSHVLLALGLDREVAESAVRISLSRFTTAAEIDRAAEVLAGSVRRLAKFAKKGRKR